MDNNPAWQLLARSAGYLKAARICVAEGENQSSLKAPILHLTAHGIEVLLKHVQIPGGKSLKKVKTEFGHDIRKLWEDNLSKPLRNVAKQYAIDAYDEAKASGKFEDNFDDDPFKLLEEYLHELSELHSRRTDFALRYILQPEQKGPRPRLLIDTFSPTTDEFIRRFSRL